jgi:hypothetical protein
MLLPQFTVVEKSEQYKPRELIYEDYPELVYHGIEQKSTNTEN